MDTLTSRALNLLQTVTPPIVHIAMMNSASGQSMVRPMYKEFPNYDYAEL
jgi:alpha-glucosidase (family GH31 glycosyl hydrolase)